MANMETPIDSEVIKNCLGQIVNREDRTTFKPGREFNEEEEQFNKLFSETGDSKPVGIENGIPWKRVTPIPGLCIKLFTPDGDKVFVNICHTSDLPAPKDINDEELISLLESDDPSSYRIPMSIADEHKETDKSGALCSVYDIAVHTSLMEKIEKNQLFRVFFMTIVVEGLQDKYKIKINLSNSNPFIVLKNRRVLGTLRAHRIQVRDVKPAPTPIIQEVVSSANPSKVLPDPKLKLELHPAEGDPLYLIARIKIKAFSNKDVHLDVGEDRLVLTSKKRLESFVDIFLPYNIDQSKTTAEYSSITQELKIHMPIVQ